MSSKYTVNVKASDNSGMIATRRTFKGEASTAYTQAMEYATRQAERYNGKDFTITIQGDAWRTAAKVNPNFSK